MGQIKQAYLEGIRLGIKAASEELAEALGMDAEEMDAALLSKINDLLSQEGVEHADISPEESLSAEDKMAQDTDFPLSAGETAVGLGGVGLGAGGMGLQGLGKNLAGHQSEMTRLNAPLEDLRGNVWNRAEQAAAAEAAASHGALGGQGRSALLPNTGPSSAIDFTKLKNVSPEAKNILAAERGMQSPNYNAMLSDLTKQFTSGKDVKNLQAELRSAFPELSAASKGTGASTSREMKDILAHILESRRLEGVGASGQAQGLLEAAQQGLAKQEGAIAAQQKAHPFLESLSNKGVSSKMLGQIGRGMQGAGVAGLLGLGGKKLYDVLSS